MVDSGQNEEAITPLGKFQLKKIGSAEFTVTSRIVNTDNIHVRIPHGHDVVLSGAGVLKYKYKTLDPAATDDELIILVRITDIQ